MIRYFGRAIASYARRYLHVKYNNIIRLICQRLERGGRAAMNRARSALSRRNNCAISRPRRCLPSFPKLNPNEFAPASSLLLGNQPITRRLSCRSPILLVARGEVRSIAFSKPYSFKPSHYPSKQKLFATTWQLHSRRTHRRRPVSAESP